MGYEFAYILFLEHQQISLDSFSKQLLDSLERIKTQPIEIWMVKLADLITNLQPPPLHWTQAKILKYRDEAIEIHTHLQAASPFLATRLAEKIQKYQVSKPIDPRTP